MSRNTSDMPVMSNYAPNRFEKFETEETHYPTKNSSSNITYKMAIFKIKNANVPDFTVSALNCFDKPETLETYLKSSSYMIYKTQYVQRKTTKLQITGFRRLGEV